MGGTLGVPQGAGGFPRAPHHGSSTYLQQGVGQSVLINLWGGQPGGCGGGQKDQRSAAGAGCWAPSCTPNVNPAPLGLSITHGCSAWLWVPLGQSRSPLHPPASPCPPHCHRNQHPIPCCVPVPTRLAAPPGSILTPPPPPLLPGMMLNPMVLVYPQPEPAAPSGCRVWRWHLGTESPSHRGVPKAGDR